MVAAYDRRGEGRADGYANTAAALRAACRIAPGAARNHIDLARKLERLPATRAAFAAGEIGRQHAQVIAWAYTPERAAAITKLEPELVAAAQHMHPRDLNLVVRHACDTLDGDGGASQDEQNFRLRRLHVSASIAGIGFLDGRLDAEGIEIVMTALEAEMERDRTARDPRTRAQARADALVNLARRALDRGELGGTRAVRPHITIVADLERLTGDAEVISQLRAEAAHAGHLSHATLERLTCDCNVTRVLTAGRSEVLDVGRATRTIPPALWKALVARDRHCQAPGCDRPAHECEAHHIVHWSQGGTTSLDNLILACTRDHRDYHGWSPDAQPP